MRRVRRPLCVVLAVGAVLMSSAAEAAGGPASVTIDDLTPTLSEADDGSWSATLGFTNLTKGDITLTAAAANAKPGCEPTLDKPTVTAASHADVKITLRKGCKSGSEPSVFTVAAQKPAQPFTVTAVAEPDEAKPNWDQLLVFPAALLLALCGVGTTFRRWKPPGALMDPTDEESTDETPAVASGATTGPGDDESTKPKLKGPLKYLDATYDFKESLVSNVTAIGAVLTGIFGSSDVIEAAFGKDAEAEIGLATVGAAIAVAFIGAGTIIPLAVKARNAKSFTVIGILLGAGVTLAGAAGELWVVTQTGVNLDLGNLATLLLWVAFVLTLGLLAAYGHTAVIATLNQGSTAPNEEPSDALVAAQMIVAALSAKADIDQGAVNKALKQIPKYPGGRTSSGDDPFPRRRAATL